MNSSPSVIVNKGGPLTALVKGVFGIVMVVVVCGTALGLYALRMADRELGGITQQVLAAIPDVVRALPEWQKGLPPLYADALNDRRALEYRKSLDVATKVRSGHDMDDDSAVVTIEVTNNGSEVLSLLTLRLLVEDDSTKSADMTVAAATPVGIGNWRGPLLPGQSRRIPQVIREIVGEPKVTVEVTDVRVWNGPAPKPQPESETAPQAPKAAEVRQSA